MQGRKRALAALLCLMALLLVLPSAAFAAEEGESPYRVVIEDGADLLTAAEEESLREVMEKVLPYGNAAFVSTLSNPTTSEQYAEHKFLEFFGDTSGALLLIDMDHRYIQLIADGEVYKTVNRTRCSEIADDVYSYASKGNYARCATKTFEQVVRLLENQGIATSFFYVTSAYVTNAFLAICLALLGNFALMSFQRRKKVAPEDALNVKVDVNAASSAARSAVVAGVVVKMLSQRKTKHVESSSGGGRSGGGGHSGGGGGFSGGGGGHRF